MTETAPLTGALLEPPTRSTYYERHKERAKALARERYYRVTEGMVFTRYNKDEKPPTVKRARGRPRKDPSEKPQKEKKPMGRPRKNGALISPPDPLDVIFEEFIKEAFEKT